MNDRGNARRAILDSIRESLAASRPHDEARTAVHAAEAGRRPAKGIPLPLAPDGATAAPPSVLEVPLTRAEQFCAQLRAVGGRCAVVSNRAEVPRIVKEILIELKARSVALSDAADVQSIMDDERDATLKFLLNPSQAELFDADAGVSSAQWGVAETGTLILQSSEERHRMVSLIPPIHIAVLRRDHICGTLADAMERLRSEDGELESRAITFITGPSRTADIEQMLVVGVHGPQILVVIVIDEVGPEG